MDDVQNGIRGDFYHVTSLRPVLEASVFLFHLMNTQSNRYHLCEKIDIIQVY